MTVQPLSFSYIIAVIFPFPSCSKNIFLSNVFAKKIERTSFWFQPKPVGIVIVRDASEQK